MGKDDVREAVLDAAKVAFRSRGYMKTTMKGVAAAAGVAPEVVTNYYNSKDKLFDAVLRLPFDPVGSIPAIVAPGVDGLGERLVRVTLDTFKDPDAREDLMQLAKAGVSSGKAVAGIRGMIEEGIVDRLAGVIGVPDARLRANLITSYLLGIAAGRYIVRMEPLASMSDDDIVRLVSPTIQGWLTPTKPLPGQSKDDSSTNESGPKAKAVSSVSKATSGSASAVKKSASKQIHRAKPSGSNVQSKSTAKKTDPEKKPTPKKATRTTTSKTGTTRTHTS
ncbi:MAG: TetR family transcriptional regulator [Candidatus Nanopelagicales bacterium]